MEYLAFISVRGNKALLIETPINVGGYWSQSNYESAESNQPTTYFKASKGYVRAKREWLQLVRPEALEVK